MTLQDNIARTICARGPRLRLPPPCHSQSTALLSLSKHCTPVALKALHSYRSSEALPLYRSSEALPLYRSSKVPSSYMSTMRTRRRHACGCSTAAEGWRG